MRIIVCGAGSTGLHVARVLGEVHEVTVIERMPAHVPTDPAGLRFIVGDAADPGVLLEAGGRDADALVAVTRDDPTNLVTALLAKHGLGVRWTVARMKDATHEWLFTPELGVDVVVSTAALVARLVQEEVTAGDLVTLLRLRGAGVAVTETTLPPGAAIAGLRSSELQLPEGTALTGIIREGHLLLPERAGRLVAGDVVVALCEPGREHALHRIITG